MNHLRAAELDLPGRFYFLAHDLNGARRLHERGLGYGLTACLIADLLWSGWARVEPNPHRWSDDGSALLSLADLRKPAPADLIRRHAETGAAGARLPLLWRQVANEPWRHSLRTWLDFGAANDFALDQVRARLIADGHLRKAPRHRHVAEDISTANSPGARLWGVLAGLDQEPDGRTVTLLALAEAAGLRDALLDTKEPVAAKWLDWYLESLKHDSTMKPIADLATQTAAAVGASVLTRGA